MHSTSQVARTASTGRMVIVGLGAFILLLLAGALALWVKLGSVVFFELIATGIAYCF